MTKKIIELKDGLPLPPMVCSIILAALQSYDDEEYVGHVHHDTVTHQVFDLVVYQAKIWPNLKENDWKWIGVLADYLEYPENLPEWKDLYFSDSADKDIH